MHSQSPGEDNCWTSEGVGEQKETGVCSSKYNETGKYRETLADAGSLCELLSQSYKQGADWFLFQIIFTKMFALQIALKDTDKA